MPDINLDALPLKFQQTHYKLIDGWLSRYVQREMGPVFQIIPREPLGSLDDPIPETVEIVELQLSDQTVDGARVLYVIPRNPASQTTIENWTAKHSETPKDDFDWVPFVGSVNASAR